MQRLFVFLSIFILSACASNSVENKKFDIVPAKIIKRVDAVYPANANGQSGYVKVQYMVTAQGTVLNPTVVESNPVGVFDQAAINAARQMQYKPRIVDGQPQAIQGVTYKFFFNLNNGK